MNYDKNDKNDKTMLRMPAIAVLLKKDVQKTEQEILTIIRILTMPGEPASVQLIEKPTVSKTTCVSYGYTQLVSASIVLSFLSLISIYTGG